MVKYNPEEIEWSENASILIPRIGTHMQLTEDWKFRLYKKKNDDLSTLFGVDWYEIKNDYVNVTLFKNTVIKVDKILIKRFNISYNKNGEKDIFEFRLVYSPENLLLIDALSGKKRILMKGKRPKFSVKIKDVNNIKTKIDRDSLPIY